MAERDGGRYLFTTGLNNDNLRAGAAQAANMLGGIGNRAVAEGTRIDNAFRKAATGLGSFFVAQKASLFFQQIVKVRGEIESLSISFETLLGSKQKADALFSQIKEYAARTPLELAPLARGAQTLLSFNIEAEKVIPLLKQIGDISMGSSDRFNSLVLAFSQMHSTGKLMGQDLMQMINAGFNPLSVIAEKTGKSIGDLKDEMSKGAISAETVTEAFAAATSEGGKFHGMLDRQSQGIEGSISNLHGAIDDMMNELGTKSQGVITASIAGATKLVESYEAVGREIIALVTAFGAYKAALITLNAVKKVDIALTEAAAYARTMDLMAIRNGERGIKLLTAAEYKNAAAKTILTGAYQRLTAAIRTNTLALMKNPYVLVAAAVAALTYGVYKLVTAETAAEAAQRKHNEAMEAAREKKENLISKTQELIDKITDETQAVRARIKAWKELEEEMPEVFAGMTMQEVQDMKPEDVRKMMNEAADKRETDRINRDVEDARKLIESLKKDIADNLYNEANSDRKTTVDKRLNRQLREAEETLRLKKEIKAENDKILELENFEAKTVQEKIAHYNEEIERLETEKRQLDTLLQAGNDIDITNEWGRLNFATMSNISNLEAVNNLLNETRGKLKALQDDSSDPNYGKAYEDAKKEWETAKREFRKIEKDRDKYTKNQYKDAREREEAAKKAFADLGGDTKSKPKDYSDELKKNAEEEKRMVVDLQFRIARAEIDAMNEGAKKELAWLKLNHEERREEIRREGEELLKTYMEGAKTKWKEAGSKGKFENSSYYKAANEKYQKQSPVFETGDDKPGELWKNEIAAYNAATKKVLTELTDKYQDYATQRLAIEKKFNDDITMLRDQRSEAEKAGNTKLVVQLDGAISKATADKGKELVSFDFNVFKESPEYVRAFEDLENTSTETLKSLLSRLETAKSMATTVLDPSDLREYVSTIQSITDELRTRDPFGALRDAKRKLAEADKELAGAKEDLDRTLNGTPVIKGISVDQSTGKLVAKYISLEEATKNYNKALDNQNKKQVDTTKATGKVLQLTGKLSDAVEKLGDAVGGEAGAIIGLIGNVGNVVTSAISGMEAASQAGSSAMKTVERASVILSVISFVIQVATKVADLLGGESSAEKYEKSKEIYESYIDILDRVIEKQLELAEALTGKNASAAYDKAVEMVEAQAKAARKLGRQYLNSGASEGFLGIGSSHSKGYMEVEEMSDEGWKQAAKAMGMSVEQFKDMMGGRMDGLFDLSLEQLEKLYSEAPLFIAQLDSDTQNYLNQIMDSERQIAEIWEQKISGLTLLDKDALLNDFLDLLSDMDSSSKDFAENFEEYLKKAIFNSMLKEKYADRLEEWRKALAASLENDGKIDDEEYEYLKRLYDGIEEDARRDREEYAERFGWDSSEEREASQKGFASMSQDSADELNGKFTHFTALAYSINENAKILVVNSGMILQHLSGIRDNTEFCRRLDGMDADLRSLRQGVDDIILKGIKIKTT